jgi:hypothetical protein
MNRASIRPSRRSRRDISTGLASGQMPDEKGAGPSTQASAHSIAMSAKAACIGLIASTGTPRLESVSPKAQAKDGVELTPVRSLR